MFYVLSGIFSFFFALFVGAVIIGLIAVVCIYITRDAKKYRMNARFWIAVVILLQFIGLCLYWHARKKQCSRRCPVCGAEIPQGKESCILCGVELETVRPIKNSVGRFIVSCCAFQQAFFIIMPLAFSVAGLMN